MNIRTLSLTVGVAGMITTIGFAQQTRNDPSKPNKNTQPGQEQQKYNDSQKDRDSLDRDSQGRVLGRSTTAAIMTGKPFLAVKASDLIGKDIQNSQGKQVADVNNLLLDVTQGRVAGVVVGVGGVVGIGEKQCIVPPQALQCQVDADKNDPSKSEREKDKVLVLQNEQTLQTATTKREDLKNYTALGQVYRDYHQDAYWETNSTAQTNMASLHLKDAKALMGKEVRNRSDKDIGELQDFIVDLNSGRIVYATMKTGQTLGVGGKLIAVSPRQFEINDSGKLVINTTEERLKNAPEFDESRWHSLNDPTWMNQVYGYYGETTYWMDDNDRRHVREKDDGQSNPKKNTPNERREDQRNDKR